MEQKVTAYLRQMKEARGCTQQQIADESGVPIGTVGKYIAGLEARLDEKDERIEHRGRIASEDHQRAEEAIAYERRRARIAMTISYIVMGLFVLIVLMFVVDWMVPTVGWIRE